MKIQFLPCALLGVLLLAGCASEGTKTVVEPNKAEVVTTGIDPADFKRVADDLRNSIVENGVLRKFAPRLAVIGVSTVVNNTSQRLNVDNLTGAITTALQQDATVMINRGVGPDGKPRYEDPKSAEGAQIDRFLKGTKVAPQIDLGLSGTINEDYSRAGKDRQYTYTIHMRLTQGETVVWQGQVEFRKLTKQKGGLGL